MVPALGREFEDCFFFHKEVFLRIKHLHFYDIKTLVDVNLVVLQFCSLYHPPLLPGWASMTSINYPKVIKFC